MHQNHCKAILLRFQNRDTCLNCRNMALNICNIDHQFIVSMRCHHVRCWKSVAKYCIKSDRMALYVIGSKRTSYTYIGLMSPKASTCRICLCVPPIVMLLLLAAWMEHIATIFTKQFYRFDKVYTTHFHLHHIAHAFLFFLIGGFSFSKRKNIIL